MKNPFIISILALSLALSSTTEGALPRSNPNKNQTAEESISDDSTAVTFVPPAGWRVADPESLPKNVKIMVVGKSKNEYPPSINLTTEEFKGTTKDYLKIVKNINDAQKSEWKDLGYIKTESGEASLSQVDSKSEWGSIRMMHVITVKQGIAYILTAAALQSDFPKFYKEFFNSMKTLKINKNIYEFVKDSKKQDLLKKATKELNLAFNKLKNDKPDYSQTQVFNSEEFQVNYWKPFQAKIENDYSELKDEKLSFFFQQVEKNLTETKTENR